MTTANGKTVLVTGGSRGIGAAIARQLAGIGMNVVINYASDEGAANAVVASITAIGGVANAVKGDVSKSDQFAHLFDQAESRFGGLDMLVNNAGQMSPMLIADVDEERFDRLFAINVRGVLNGCKLAAKRLRDGGRIVEEAPPDQLFSNPRQERTREFLRRVASRNTAPEPAVVMEPIKLVPLRRDSGGEGAEHREAGEVGR